FCSGAGGAPVTLPWAAGTVPGVTRALGLGLARGAGMIVREEPLTVARVRRTAELFLTASTIEIVPLVRLDARAVGGGRAGELTHMLQARYGAHVRRVLRVAGPP